MNERIKQLAIQAGFFYEDYKDIWYLEYHNESCEEEMKKFAELIVKECADYVQFYYKDHACEVIAHDMKTHFGVKQ
jgi:hypothetical protein